MFERGIGTADVTAALGNGRIVGDYPDDRPYPSCLWLGDAGGRPLHVVFADDPAGGVRIIITVYEPDPALWGPDLATRRRP